MQLNVWIVTLNAKILIKKRVVALEPKTACAAKTNKCAAIIQRIDGAVIKAQYVEKIRINVMDQKNVDKVLLNVRHQIRKHVVAQDRKTACVAKTSKSVVITLAINGAAIKDQYAENLKTNVMARTNAKKAQ